MMTLFLELAPFGVRVNAVKWVLYVLLPTDFILLKIAFCTHHVSLTCQKISFHGAMRLQIA